MSTAKTDYWKVLTQWFSFTIHQLVYIPACCIRAIEQELRTRHNSPKELQRPPQHPESNIIDHFEAAKRSRDHVEKAAMDDQPYLGRGCGDNIITRANSNCAHDHTRLDNDTFHDWLANDQPSLDLNETLPHAYCFAQNLEGFNEEHLQRIEKYWAEHQLSNPGCPGPAKAAKFATAADWERTKRIAIENNERLQSQ